MRNNASNCISQITDSLTSRVWTYTYDASDRMTTIKDRRGMITVTNQYDPTSGRVTQQTLATGTPDQAIYQFAYTTAGRSGPIPLNSRASWISRSLVKERPLLYTPRFY